MLKTKFTGKIINIGKYVIPEIEFIIPCSEIDKDYNVDIVKNKERENVRWKNMH